jgi:hypothetical protein
MKATNLFDMNTRITKGLLLALIFTSFTSFAQLKVFQNGNVSIGGTSALPWPFELQVAGNSVFSATQSSITSAGMIRGLNAYSTATTPDFTWYGNDQTGLFHPTSAIIGFSINGSEGMRLTSNALLLGLTTDPGNVKLDIAAPSGNQAIYSTTNFSTDYNYHQINNTNRGLTKALVVQLSGTDEFIVWGNGNVWCNGSYSSSDKSLKENIDTLRGALAKIKLLQGVTYNFKTSRTGMDVPKKEIGLIAQDAEKIIPEAVATNDKGLKGIAYGNLVALVIEAVKEQQKQLDSLKQALAACCNSRSGNRNTGSIEQTIGINQQVASTNGAILYQNTPNPFSQTTIVKCFVPDASKTASLLVFDMNGSLKKTFSINEKGTVNTTINASQLVPGMYYYTLLIDGQEIDTKKMILTE